MTYCFSNCGTSIMFSFAAVLGSSLLLVSKCPGLYELSNFLSQFLAQRFSLSRQQCAAAIAAPLVSPPLVQKLGTASYSSTVFSESAIYYRLIPDISTTDSLTVLTRVMGRFRELLLQIWKTVAWGWDDSQLVQIKYTSNNVQCPP